MEWNWATKAFISYDPYTDTRIDPPDGKGGSDDRVPFFLHSAVRRAKVLVDHAPLSKIISDVELIEHITITVGVFLYEKRKKTDDGKLLYSGAAGVLKDYLAIASKGPIPFSRSKLLDFSDDGIAYIGVSKKNIPIERWPYLFGVLALSIAGKIVNELWPTEELSAVPPRFDNGNVGCSPDCPDYLTDRDKELSLYCDTADALQAVGFGEGLLVAEEYRNKHKSAAEKSPKAHQKLYEIFNSWALSQPVNHGFVSTEDAVNVGFKHYLKNDEKFSDLLSKVGERTHRTLKEKLENYCEENSKDYPFPRKRSKRKIN